VPAMLHDLTQWLLYSPRRLIAVAAVVLGLASVAWSGLASEDTEPQAAPVDRSAPSREAPPTSTTNAAVASERPGSSRAVLSVAREFLAQYVVPPGVPDPDATPVGLRAVSTPALWDGLRLTRPDALPRGTVLTVELQDVGPFSGTVLAELDPGLDVTLSVVAWQRGWRVGDVRPAEDS
jgi:hypothetical protein